MADYQINDLTSRSIASNDNIELQKGPAVDGLSGRVDFAAIKTWLQGQFGAVFGDMFKATYDPTGVNGDTFDMDNMAESATSKVMTAEERLDIQANNAKVTNATHTGDVSGATVLTIGALKVQTGMIANLAVTEGKVADNAISAAKLKANAVTTVKVLDANITEAKLATGSVINAKIGTNAVSVDKMAQDGTTGQVLTSGGPGVNPSYQEPYEGDVEEAPQDGTPYSRQDAGWVSSPGAGTAQDQALMYAISDEGTQIEAGVQLTARVPYAFTISNIRLSLTTAGSTTTEIDTLVGGVSVHQSGTRPTMLNGEKTSIGNAVTINNPAAGDDLELTFNIVQAGTGATGAKVSIIGTPA